MNASDLNINTGVTVSIDNASIERLAIAIVISALLIMLVNIFIKRVF